MSFFMGGTGQYATVDPEKVKLASIQFEATSTTFNNVLSTCTKKCMGHEYGEADLNTGEQSCADRCVSKFFQANQKIGRSVQYNRDFNINKMPEYKKVDDIIHAQGKAE